MDISKEYKEKIVTPSSGIAILVLSIVLMLISTGSYIWGGIVIENDGGMGALLMIIATIVLCLSIFLMCGLKIVSPNEAMVLLMFGKYFGTINKDGFFWTIPFAIGYNPVIGSMLRGNSKISLKATTLSNEKQKVNDLDGNPIEIGVNIIWRIINTSKAVFDVENYLNFISTQADSAIRHVARLYPYDSTDDDEKSLRGSSQEISEELKNELQRRVDMAGIEIMEARISHLAYAQEIAAAMLQRQQASAIIAARQKIVEGAVGMVEMAIEKLSESGVVELDDERKATMVSNLMVVLCGNKDPQPVLNSGSIY
ncbi:MAG: SPFH domain-containing protein [Chloroflexi bacterium]|nr:SPFH domain-containing protein [Chloroflexota bacterium]